MTGVVVKFTGTNTPQGKIYGFSVSSSHAHVQQLPQTNAALRPDDPRFLSLTNFVNTPHANSNVITDAGQALYDMLAAHPSTNTAFPAALQANAMHPDRYIRLHLPPYASEMASLPWEALYHHKYGFLENNQALPILRMVKTKPEPDRRKAELTDEGLRICSVIAAQGIDGLSEYKALMSALKNYKRKCVAHIYSSDQSVIEAINNDTFDEPLSVVLNHVPSSANELMDHIAEFAPQICHFFCHGVAIGDKAARLELETKSTKGGAAPVEVKAYQLAKTLPSSAWLVLLNACDSGTTPSDTGSLAARLVAEGVPAVVGMREPTQSRTLNSFTRGFLHQALVSLDTLAKAGAPFTLDLRDSITAGRDAICASFRMPDGDPTIRIKDWTLPVIFLGTAPLTIEPRAKPVDTLLLASLESERGTLILLLDRLHGKIKAAKEDAINGRIAELDDKIMKVLG